MNDESQKALQRIRDGEAWEDFCDRLKNAGKAVLDASPDDDLDRAEGLRYLSRLTSTFLGNATSDPMPARTSLRPMGAKIGLDNPDYVYFNVPLSHRHEYIVRGHMGDAHLIGFGTFSGGLGTKEGLIRDGYLESSELELGRVPVRCFRDNRLGSTPPSCPARPRRCQSR